MRVSGNHYVAILVGKIQECLLNIAEREDDTIGLVSKPQAKVRGDLIVPASSGVQLVADLANHFDQTCLDK